MSYLKLIMTWWKRIQIFSLQLMSKMDKAGKEKMHVGMLQDTCFFPLHCECDVQSA
jgi:hypothetical protein